MKQAELAGLVRLRLGQGEMDRLGSLAWHVTTVRLELEVRGEVVRRSLRPVVLGLG